MSANFAGSLRSKVLPKMMVNPVGQEFQGLIPLGNYRYHKQLSIKQQKMEKILKTMVQKLKGFNSSVKPDSSGLPCLVERIKRSPLIKGYRNLDDFSIWPGPDGNPKTVGYIMGKISNQENPPRCLPPDDLMIVKDSHKNLAAKFQDYLRNHSPYDICQNFSLGGHWRRFCIRSNDLGELMGIAIMHPQNLTQEQLQEEEQRLHSFFAPIAEDLNLKSLYFQACPGVRCTHRKAPFRLLLGNEYIEEVVNGCIFRITPEPFFQINKGAAEILYRTIIEAIEPEADMHALDLCCGSGVLAVQLAPLVQQVVGVDSCEQAIQDAIINAKINKVDNCNFISGTVEDHLSKLCEDYYSENVVMVVNPGSTGLRSSVINVIRSMSNVSKLIYVSCKPDGQAMKNFAHLCLPFRPKDDIQGDAFLPLKATPIDLFPHSDRCELVMTFSRY